MRENVNFSKRRSGGMVIIWEFLVRPEMRTRFESVYGSTGAWARFFAQAEGYIGTELNRDMTNPRRYVTLDLWASREAYEQFREQHLVQYEALDKECEDMTENEVEVGRFERV